MCPFNVWISSNLVRHQILIVLSQEPLANVLFGNKRSEIIESLWLKRVALWVKEELNCHKWIVESLERGNKTLEDLGIGDEHKLI